VAVKVQNLEVKMKNLDYYRRLNYKIEITEDETEGGFVFSVPDLPGCFTCCDNLSEGYELIKDAKEQWLKIAIESGQPISEPEAESSFSGQFKLRIPKSLHRKLVYGARSEGTSVNQYCVYLLSKNS
jgi:predicted RNase H-like HicB family nuclease